VLQADYVVTESVQMRSAPLYDAVVVTGELAGKGGTVKVRKNGEGGQLFAPQASSPLINTAGAASERGRNILSDRGEQALIELALPLFPQPQRAGEVGRMLPLDLVEVLAADVLGTVSAPPRASRCAPRMQRWSWSRASHWRGTTPMRTDMRGQFKELVSSSPRLIATVTAHNGDGTSSLTTYDGAQMRALGQPDLPIPYNVWVRNGCLLEAAPNLPLVEVAV